MVFSSPSRTDLLGENLPLHCDALISRPSGRAAKEEKSEKFRIPHATTLDPNFYVPIASAESHRVFWFVFFVSLCAKSVLPHPFFWGFFFVFVFILLPSFLSYFLVHPNRNNLIARGRHGSQEPRNRPQWFSQNPRKAWGSATS